MDRHVIARFSRARAPKNMPEKNASSTTKSEQQINYEARPQCFPSVQTHHDFTFDYIRRTKSDEADEGSSRRKQRSKPRACCTVDTAVKTSTPHFRCSRVGARWSTDVLPCIPWSIGTCSTQRLFGERAPNEEKKREKITGRQERSISALFVDANAIYRSGIISTRS